MCVARAANICVRQTTAPVIGQIDWSSGQFWSTGPHLPLWRPDIRRRCGNERFLRFLSTVIFLSRYSVKNVSLVFTPGCTRIVVIRLTFSKNPHNTYCRLQDSPPVPGNYDYLPVRARARAYTHNTPTSGLHYS